jgi:hypothetical protein
MSKAFDFCIPTRGTKVPHTPDWIHEIKYDGYRLRLERDGDGVRLITRNGYDWTKRYPWIVESALKIRQKHFVIDGEAVILGFDGRSDFDACIPESITRKSNSTPSTCWPATAMTCGSFRFRSVRPIWRGSWPVVPRASSSPHSNKARSAQTCFGRPANLGWRGTSLQTSRSTLSWRSSGIRSRMGSIQQSIA